MSRPLIAPTHLFAFSLVKVVVDGEEWVESNVGMFAVSQTTPFPSSSPFLPAKLCFLFRLFSAFLVLFLFQRPFHDILTLLQHTPLKTNLHVHVVLLAISPLLHSAKQEFFPKSAADAGFSSCSQEPAKYAFRFSSPSS